MVAVANEHFEGLGLSQTQGLNAWQDALRSARQTDREEEIIDGEPHLILLGAGKNKGAILKALTPEHNPLVPDEPPAVLPSKNDVGLFDRTYLPLATPPYESANPGIRDLYSSTAKRAAGMSKRTGVWSLDSPLWGSKLASRLRKVEEKFERNFRVQSEMRDEILVYESILDQILSEILILGLAMQEN